MSPGAQFVPPTILDPTAHPQAPHGQNSGCLDHLDRPDVDGPAHTADRQNSLPPVHVGHVRTSCSKGGLQGLLGGRGWLVGWKMVTISPHNSCVVAKVLPARDRPSRAGRVRPRGRVRRGQSHCIALQV